MTVCNMSIEAGARAGMIAPDETTFEYLRGRDHAPTGADWDAAVAAWSELRSDDDAVDNKTGIWIADTYTGMYHVDGSGAKMVYKGKTANVSGNNVGAAIDFDNNPWVISQANSAAYRVNPADYSTQRVNVGVGPYTYSDMTGYQLRNAGVSAAGSRSRS